MANGSTVRIQAGMCDRMRGCILRTPQGNMNVDTVNVHRSGNVTLYGGGRVLHEFNRHRVRGATPVRGGTRVRITDGFSVLVPNP